MSYDYLEHHGILGQKWGVRRYQNEDGSYTDEGEKRYSNTERGQKAQTKWRRAKNELKKAKKTKNKESISKAKNRYKVVKKETKKDRKYRYNSDDKLRDSFKYGYGHENATKRIEKRINEKGMTRKRARQAEDGRQYVIATLTGIGIKLAIDPEARRAAVNGAAKTASVLTKIASNSINSYKSRKAIPKIAINSKFNPIDTTMKIIS